MRIPCPYVFPPSRCIAGSHFLTRPRIDVEGSSVAVVTYAPTLIRVDRLFALFMTLGKWNVCCLVCDFNFVLHQLVSSLPSGAQTNAALSTRSHARAPLLSAYLDDGSSRPLSLLPLSSRVSGFASNNVIGRQAHQVHISKFPTPPAVLRAQPAPPLTQITCPFLQAQGLDGNCVTEDTWYVMHLPLDPLHSSTYAVDCR